MCACALRVRADMKRSIASALSVSFRAHAAQGSLSIIIMEVSAASYGRGPSYYGYVEVCACSEGALGGCRRATAERGGGPVGARELAPGAARGRGAVLRPGTSGRVVLSR